jgi:membrane protein required for colicin V production
LNPVDFALIAILIVGFIWGFRKGLVYMVFSLIAIIGGIFAGGKLAPIIVPHIFSEQYGQVGYIVLFIIIFILVYFVIKKLSHLLENVLEFMELEWLDSLLGGVLGLAQLLIIVGIILNIGYNTGVLYLIPGSDQVTIAPIVSETSRVVVDFISGNLKQIQDIAL